MKVDLDLTLPEQLNPAGKPSAKAENSEDPGGFAALLGEAFALSAREGSISAQSAEPGLTGGEEKLPAAGLPDAQEAENTAHPFLFSQNGTGQTEPGLMGGAEDALLEGELSFAKNPAFNERAGPQTSRGTETEGKELPNRAPTAEASPKQPATIDTQLPSEAGLARPAAAEAAGSSPAGETLPAKSEPAALKTSTALTGAALKEDASGSLVTEAPLAEPVKEAVKAKEAGSLNQPSEADTHKANEAAWGRALEAGRRKGAFTSESPPSSAKNAALNSEAETAPLQADSAEKAGTEGRAGLRTAHNEALHKKMSAFEPEGAAQALAQEPAQVAETLKGGTSDLPNSPNLRQGVLEQLEGKLIYLREGHSHPAEMRLTLNPPELGELTIRVFSKQGKFSATIAAGSELVKEIIESSLQELRLKMNMLDIRFEQLDVYTTGGSNQDAGDAAAGFGATRLQNLQAAGLRQEAAEQGTALAPQSTDKSQHLIDYLA